MGGKSWLDLVLLMALQSQKRSPGHLQPLLWEDTTTLRVCIMQHLASASEWQELEESRVVATMSDDEVIKQLFAWKSDFAYQRAQG